MCLVTKFILLQKLITKAWKETNHSNAAKNVTNVTDFIIQQLFFSLVTFYYKTHQIYLAYRRPL